MLARIRAIAAALLLAAGSAGVVATADGDPAWELHELLDGTNTSTSFTTAKQALYTTIDRDGNMVVCRYSGTIAALVADGSHFKPASSEGIQAEHTWASKASWADASIHFPRDSVPGADLHNLFPARRGINGSRGDSPFGVPRDDVKEYRVNPNGTLNWAGGGTATGSFVGTDEHGTRVFEPRDEHKGDVARAMFYMSVRYWWAIPDDMEGVLRRWHDADPPDAAEVARNARVQASQGNRNPFVDEEVLVDGIPDF